ncbi:Immunoglobulin I-set [Trinorchestia longiramus]|nr:Immunoglobulin I-set [Trinorchestia longiramus]
MNIPHQLVGAPVGFSFTLECTIEAHPQALTYWTRGQGAMIHHSEKFFITETPGTEPYRTHMKLTVKDLQEDDFGSYKCVAKNSRGETEGEMKLYKSQPPTPTPTNPPYFLDKLFKGEHNSGSHKMAKKPPPHHLPPGVDPSYPYDPHSSNRNNKNKHSYNNYNSNNSVLYNPSYRNNEYDSHYNGRGYEENNPYDIGMRERGREGEGKEGKGNYFTTIFKSGAVVRTKPGAMPLTLSLLLLLLSLC